MEYRWSCGWVTRPLYDYTSATQYSDDLNRSACFSASSDDPSRESLWTPHQMVVDSLQNMASFFQHAVMPRAVSPLLEPVDPMYVQISRLVEEIQQLMDEMSHPLWRPNKVDLMKSTFHRKVVLMVVFEYIWFIHSPSQCPILKPVHQGIAVSLTVHYGKVSQEQCKEMLIVWTQSRITQACPTSISTHPTRLTHDPIHQHSWNSWFMHDAILHHICIFHSHWINVSHKNIYFIFL